MSVTDTEVQDWVGNASGQTDSQIGQDIYNGYSAAGADPAQLAALSNDQISGNGVWGSAPGDYSGWAANVNNAEGPANLATAATSAPPTGLPTSTDTAAMAPQPLQSFGATPTVTPTYANAATVNPNNTPQYLGQEEAANAASLQPTFQAQDQTEQDQLAARGISSSGAAADLTNQLYGQQAATLAGLNAPAIQQQSGYQQQDITNNQANNQATNLFNAGEGTAASGTNAGYYDQALTGNATTYNNYLSTLEGQGYNTSNEAYTAYLNSFGPNSGVTSSYGGAVQGIGNAATGAYGSSIAGEGAAIGGIAGAAGTAAAGGAFG